MALTERHEGETPDAGSEGGIVAVIGAGVMGETLISGLLRAGRSADRLLVSDRSAERLAAVTQRHGVGAYEVGAALARADTVVLAVKPQDMDEVLGQVRPHVRAGTLVVSIAAGITCAYLQDRLPAQTPVVRVMPNTPALVDQGMAAVSAGTHCEERHLQVAQDLMRSCGRVVVVAESQQDAVTALSGSGPAYIFYVVEAMIEAGVLLGLQRAVVTELVVQTLFGAATMLRETGEHPTVLREQVSSPGGTTVAALRELEEHRVRAAFMGAIEAAAQRSSDLAAG